MPALRITKAGAADENYRFLQDVLDRSMALTVRAAMRTVMLEGTGRAARSQRYEMFGKSGTAQLPKKEGGGYHEDRYVSSFIAGAPYEDPRIVVVVVMDDPDKSKGHYGGKIAGPVVRDIIDETLGYLGVSPQRD
jgi:cell division protein FtsI/penicillin-binding protein 2